MNVRHYTLENKPILTDGQIVDVDMARLGTDLGILKGEVVGRATEHIIDIWMIKFDRAFGPLYPFKVIGVPHTAIVQFWL